MSEVLEATVDRITYANASNGWAVLSMVAGSNRFKAVGELAEAQPGECLELQGQWAESSYGRQFQTAQFRIVRPASAEGIVRFLAGIPGIGPETARRIVNLWGAETLTRLAASPEAAAELPGIGPARAQEIHRAVSERGSRDEALMALQSLGMGPALAGKVLKWAGLDHALARVRRDPYALREVHGVGFTLADQIAGRVGIALADPRRVAAGVIHALEQASLDGHCCLPRSKLIAEAVKLLDVDAEQASRATEQLEGTGDLLQVDDEVYLARLWWAEEQGAESLVHLLKRSAEAIPYHPDPDSAITLSDEQQAAVEAALREKVFILTGGPGTGKTTITRAIVRSLVAADLKIVLASPTGRAAQRLSEATGQPAMTLHRLLEYNPQTKSFRRDAHHPLEADVVLLDEVSMLDLWLARAVLRAIRPDGRLILVGDSDQLPSVGPGRVLGDLIDSALIPTARLTKVFRQAAQSRIVAGAHQINAGQVPETQNIVHEDDLFLVSVDDPEMAADILIETVVDRIPAVYGLNPFEDVQVLVPMRKGSLGTEALNRRLRERLNPTGQPILNGRLRIGDRVMQIRNNYDLWVFNGEVGKIVQHDPKRKAVAVEIGGDVKSYGYSDLQQLDLAYACTIHKSQGSEYPCVVLAIHRQHFIMLQRTLFYTAVTRAKKLCVVLGEVPSMCRAVKRVGGNDRHTGLIQKLKRLHA